MSSQHYQEIYAIFFDCKPDPYQPHDYAVKVKKGKRSLGNWYIEAFNRNDKKITERYANIFRLGTLSLETPYKEAQKVGTELRKVLQNYKGSIPRLPVSRTRIQQWEKPIGRLLIHAALARVCPEWKRPVVMPTIDRAWQRTIVHVDLFDPRERKMVVLKYHMNTNPKSALYNPPSIPQDANIQFGRRSVPIISSGHDDHDEDDSVPQVPDDVEMPDSRPMPLQIWCGAEKLVRLIAVRLHEAAISAEDAHAIIASLKR